MTKLTVSCDCREWEQAVGEGKLPELQDFLARKRWASEVEVQGHVCGEVVFVKAENRDRVHQVAIERGECTCWLCKHGIAALNLLGKNRTQVIWERDQAERVARSVKGHDVRLYEVNGCASVVCW